MSSDFTKRDVLLAQYTTYKIGGPADYFVEVENTEELIYFVKFGRKKGLPVFVLGCGANILISDKGFRGLVILNRSNNVFVYGNVVVVDSGVKIADLIGETLKFSLSGFEHFAGIPSTVGGAIKQNLHFLAPDRKDTFYIQNILKQVTVIDESNEIVTLENSDLEFGYDDNILHRSDLIVLGATFELIKEDQSVIEKQIEDNLRWRRERHPDWVELPSCGSVFKKIKDVGAGRLIEQVGLKGRVLGRVQVSPKHANFLVNLGGATASEVKELIEIIQIEVQEKTGYLLEPEIGFMGDF